MLFRKCQDTFGIDISSDNPSIHPQCYCHPCEVCKSKQNRLQTHQLTSGLITCTTSSVQCAWVFRKQGYLRNPSKLADHPTSLHRLLLKNTKDEIAANSILPDMDPANILNVPDELKCYLCSSLLKKPIELTTCQKYACAECCCQNLQKAESLSCPCCGTDHVADFCTVRQPPEAILAFIQSLTTNITHVIKKPSHVPYITPAEKHLL